VAEKSVAWQRSTARWQAHGRDEDRAHNSLEGRVFQVEESSFGHEGADQLEGWLRAVLLSVRHGQVIEEEQQLFALHAWAVHALALLLELALEVVLDGGC